MLSALLNSRTTTNTLGTRHLYRGTLQIKSAYRLSQQPAKDPAYDRDQATLNALITSSRRMRRAGTYAARNAAASTSAAAPLTVERSRAATPYSIPARAGTAAHAAAPEVGLTPQQRTDVALALGQAAERGVELEKRVAAAPYRER